MDSAAIDGYKTLDTLGSGDFAVTYLVSNADDERLALKLARSSTGDVAERLRDEARILSELSHRSIPAHVDSGEDKDGNPYLVMALAPGRTLKARLDEHAERNDRFSDYETLLVVAGLLDALCYLSSEGYVHRDIKAANVIVTESLDGIHLIDFGFCKEANATDKRKDDSFFRAGAARYAPPEKHLHPAHAVPVHDVFGVGVLAYQMLTGEFPWSTDGDDGDLLAAMAAPPVQIEQHNNIVRPQVSELVMKLLRIDDAYRPSACDALTVCQTLLNSSARLTVGPRGIPIRFPHVWRDPLYGDIRLTSEEMRIIDTAEMQRLRGYRQLGLTSLVFEGARHSRLLHSVGCVQRVEQILSTISQVDGITIEPDLRLAARLFALTHDVTHIPVGHTLEDEYLFFGRHDGNYQRVQRLVLDTATSELARQLEQTEVGREVRKHFDPDSTVHGRSDITELVSGPVGADVLDYVDRDSMFLGLDHKVDSAMMRQLSFRAYGAEIYGDRHLVSIAHGAYGLRSDRQYALESLYEQRYALFLKAYTHKTKLKASALLAKALGICLLEGKPIITENAIERMTSDEKLFMFLQSTRRDRAARLIDKLDRRELPAAAFRASFMNEVVRTGNDFNERYNEARQQLSQKLPDMKSRIALEERLAKAAGIPADDVFLYIPPAAPGIKRTQSHRFLVDAKGQPLTAGDEWFRRLRQKHLSLWELWVFVDPSVDQNARSRLSDEVENEFQIQNQIAEHVRQRRLF